MAKLEGFSRVAVVNYGGGYHNYHFAIYDDGIDYQVGDMVVVSGGSTLVKIQEIIDVEEAHARFDKAITAEVVGKVDTTAYDKRVAQREEKERLQRAINRKKQEIRNKLTDEFLASKDPEFAEMLKRYESLK